MTVYQEDSEETTELLNSYMGRERPQACVVESEMLEEKSLNVKAHKPSAAENLENILNLSANNASLEDIHRKQLVANHVSYFRELCKTSEIKNRQNREAGGGQNADGNKNSKHSSNSKPASSSQFAGSNSFGNTNSQDAQKEIPYHAPLSPELFPSEYGLARMPVAMQFEVIIKRHLRFMGGDGALPQHFPAILMQSLPKRTRRIVRHLDIVFGGFLPKNSEKLNKYLSKLISPGTLNKLCLSHWCYLCGASVPKHKKEHYANWVIKSEFLNLSEEESIARDMLCMVLVSADRKFVPLLRWSGLFKKGISPRRIDTIKSALLGRTEFDRDTNEEVGRLRWYDKEDQQVPKELLRKYTEYFKKNEQPRIRTAVQIKYEKEHLPKIETEIAKTLRNPQFLNQNPNITTKDQLISMMFAQQENRAAQREMMNKFVFELKCLLSESALKSNDLAKKMQKMNTQKLMDEKLLEGGRVHINNVADKCEKEAREEMLAPKENATNENLLARTKTADLPTLSWPNDTALRISKMRNVWYVANIPSLRPEQKVLRDSVIEYFTEKDVAPKDELIEFLTESVAEVYGNSNTAKDKNNENDDEESGNGPTSLEVRKAINEFAFFDGRSQSYKFKGDKIVGADQGGNDVLMDG